jgi:hypothetical protein
MKYVYRILQKSFIEGNFYTENEVAVTSIKLSVSKANKPHFVQLTGKEAAAYIGAESDKADAYDQAGQPTRVENVDMHTVDFDDVAADAEKPAVVETLV